MHGSTSLPTNGQQGLVYQPIAVPSLGCVFGFGQRYRPLHEVPESIRLRKGLPVELVYPCSRTVGRQHHERDVLVKRLGHSGSKVEHGRARRDANRHRRTCGLRHTDGIEACRAFIGRGIARYLGAFVKVVHQRRIPRARADNDRFYAVFHQ